MEGKDLSVLLDTFLEIFLGRTELCLESRLARRRGAWQYMNSVFQLASDVRDAIARGIECFARDNLGPYVRSESHWVGVNGPPSGSEGRRVVLGEHKGTVKMWAHPVDESNSHCHENGERGR